MGHVQRRSGNWNARYVGPDGRERSKSFGRKIDADRFLASVEAGKLRGEWIDPRLGRITVAEAASSWLEAARPTLKPKTAAGYESLIRSRIAPELGGYQLAALRPSDVQDWIGRLQAEGLSASRIRHAHVVLRQLLQRAVNDDQIARNAADGTRLPRLQRHEAAFLEPSVVEAIAREHVPPVRPAGEDPRAARPSVRRGRGAQAPIGRPSPPAARDLRIAGGDRRSAHLRTDEDARDPPRPADADARRRARGQPGRDRTGSRKRSSSRHRAGPRCGTRTSDRRSGARRSSVLVSRLSGYTSSVTPRPPG